jgi:DNA-binding FrmR family transcriptional regulator
MKAEPQKKEILIRLKRIEGQVRGLQKMVEREAACADVLVQVAAVTAAVKRVGRAVVQASMEECLEKSEKETGAKKRESLRDLQKAISQYMDWA